MKETNVGQRIFEARKRRKISRKEIADFLQVHETTIKRYEDGNTKKLPTDRLEKIAKYLNTSIEYLMGWEEEQKPQGVKIPVLGTVPAGIPISAVEDILDYEEIPKSWENQGEFFGLKIKGDSMLPILTDGDIVIVRKQSTADNGDTVIAMVNGDDATCKRYERSNNGIMLIPNNSSYTPTFYTNEEIASLPVTIIGKVVELRRKF
ncbi:XRE family transcriptional regulator [Gemella sanguinis]|jgi:lexA repressor|uniref:LexA family protein n=1 Tax=Gemella sanguinis TaxID=84135 RepID=UPI00205AAC05|nr:MAG TPA: Repressor protein CI [Caudoviricetes sp.]